MVPVIVVSPFLDGWLSGVLVHKGKVSVGIWSIDAIEFGDGYRLDGTKSLLGTILEVHACLFAIELVEKFPSGVCQVEEGLPLLINEVAMVTGNANALRHLGGLA